MSATSASVLKDWTVISLRPAAQQAAVKRAILAAGATPLGLPALRLAPMPDAESARRALHVALRCERVVFTSPAAVHFAATLAPLTLAKGARAYAVGAASAAALARKGLEAMHPEAMNSEGLLALPDFAGPGEVGVVTAPGGRGLLAQTLRERGLTLHLADVYRRLPPRFDRRHFDALARCRAPRAVLLTSAEALEHALAALPPASLLDAVAVASSDRLAQLARERGFAAVILAGAPTPRALLDALAMHAAQAALPVA